MITIISMAREDCFRCARTVVADASFLGCKTWDRESNLSSEINWDTEAGAAIEKSIGVVVIINAALKDSIEVKQQNDDLCLLVEKAAAQGKRIFYYIADDPDYIKRFGRWMAKVFAAEDSGGSDGNHC